MSDTYSDISIGLIREPDFGYEKGDVLLGRYRILNETRGGAGQIYYCLDLYNQTPCVLKAPLIQFMEGRTQKDARLFLDEMRRLVDLPPHENVIRFYRVEIIQDIYFIVMEWADSSLRKRLSAGKSIELKEILNIAISICRGLEHCVRCLSTPGCMFVHGDLKPANILLTEKGRVRIADFGVGGYTRGYASPEQLRGERPDSRSDIYSLGKIMQELLECGHGVNVSLSKEEQRFAEIMGQCQKERVEDRIQSISMLEALLTALYEELTGQKVAEPERSSIDENLRNMTRACNLASIGEYKRAYELLNGLVEKETEEAALAQGYYNIAEIFRNNRLYKQALEFYDRAIAMDHDTNSRIWANRGVTCRSMNNWEEAHRCMEHALKINPYDGPAIENDIDCLIKLNRQKELEPILERLKLLYKERPEEEGLLKNIAYILYIKKDFKGACQYYGRYLRHQRDDDWASVYYYSMSLYFEYDTTRAQEFFRTAVHMMEAGGEEEKTPTKLLYLSVSCYYLMDFENSVKYLEEFQKRAEPLVQSELLEHILAVDLLISKRYYPDLQKAGRQLAETAWTNNRERFYMGIIGDLEEQRERWERELPYGEQSRLVRHMNMVCFSHEAVAYMELERWEEAATACDRALSRDHSSPENLYNKGKALCSLGRYEEALACFEKSADFQRDVDRAHNVRLKIEEVRDLMNHSEGFQRSFFQSMMETAERSQGKPDELQELISGREELFNEEFVDSFSYYIRERIMVPLMDGSDRELFGVVRQAVFVAGIMQQIYGRTREICIEGAIMIYELLGSYAFDYGGVFLAFMTGIQPFLGLAYLHRIRGSREDNIERSISYLKDCVEQFSGRGDKGVLAETYDNLGNAYVDRVAGSRDENLAAASMYYEKGLSLVSEETDPKEWAMLQYNVGVCESKKDNRAKAVQAFQNSLKYYTAERNPEIFAKAHRGIGDILARSYQEAERGEDMLNMAVYCYQNALSHYNHRDFPRETAALWLCLALAMKKKYELLQDDSRVLSRNYYDRIVLSDLPESDEIRQVYEEVGEFLNME